MFGVMDMRSLSQKSTDLTILLGMAVMAWLAVFTDLCISCLAADTWDHGGPHYLLL